MRPTSDTALQRPDLGQIVYEAMTDAPSMGYIGLEVMPPLFVQANSAEFPVMPKESLFNLLETARGPLGHYNRGDEDFESGYYKTVENGLERRIDDRFLALYRTLFDYERTIATTLLKNILRAQEYRIASKLMSETAFETAIAATTNWATIGTASPKTDTDLAVADLRSKGIIANALVISWATYLNLTKNTEIKTEVEKRFPDTAKTGNINVNHLLAYFVHFEKILVGGALVNSANRNQDATLANIWSDTYGLVCRVATGEGSDIVEPCIGRTFIWNEGATQELIVEEYYDDTVRSNILRVRHDSIEGFLTSYDSDNTAKSENSKAAGYLIDVTGN